MSRFVLVGLVLIIGCTPPAPEVEPPHLLWSTDAQSLDNPFPDQRLFVDGHFHARPRFFTPLLPKRAVTARVNTYFSAMMARAETEVTSIGHFGGTLLLASEALDDATLPGAIARLTQQDDGSWAVLEADVPVQSLRQVYAEKGITAPDDTPHVLFIRPRVPMPERHRGLLVVRARLKTATGAALGQGFEFREGNAALLDTAATALHVDAKDLLLALPQDADDLTTPLQALSRWAHAHPPEVVIPAHAVLHEGSLTRPVGVWRSTDGDWSTLMPFLTTYAFSRPVEHVGAVVIGDLQARDLRDETKAFSSAWLADPSQAPVVPLHFVLATPLGTPPAGGWPMVMAQHGVGGRNIPRSDSNDSFCLLWAEALARRGMGCIGIDAPEHGTRGAFTNFFSMEDLPALRDRFREMTFDLLQVEAALRTLDVEGDGAADFTQVRYLGNSLGSIFGAGFLPLSHEVSTAALNVPGAGLSNLIVSDNLEQLLGLLLVAQTGLVFESPEYYGAFPLFRVAAQPFFDRADPINVAHLLPARINVLQQAGTGDLIIPNDTSVDLAHALGLAFDGSDARHAFELFVPQDFGEPADFNGHNIMWNITPIREQVLTFLESDGATLTTP